ncbi:MAG: hypothetical protein RR910_01365 [Acidaminococcaceae bacterium]
MNSNDAMEAYKAMTGSKKKFGRYYKCLFHIHTPASYDFQLYKEWNENTLGLKSDQDIFEQCIKQGIFPKEGVDLEKIAMDKIQPIFNNKKEFLLYILVAYRLCVNNIGILIVSDHHTIAGVKKLKAAISELYRFRRFKVYPEVVGGIEISCADRNHVVVIYDSSDRSSHTEKINEWLTNNLLNNVEGSFRTSLDVMEEMQNLGTIPYIAHIDESIISTDETYLSGAYKERLLNSEHLKIVGISNFKSQRRIRKFLGKYRNSEFSFVIDNDAHCIENLDDKFIYIKGSKPNFFMIREALQDYDVSVRLTNLSHANVFIKGIYVEPKKHFEKYTGFLSSEDGSKAFVIRFSEALNCFIGGRGTGKSTVLELLEYVLSQKCTDEKTLDFLSSHGNTWVLCENHGIEYLVEMLMPYKETEEDNILLRFGQNIEHKYSYNYYFSSEKVQEFTLKNFISVYSIAYGQNNEPVFMSVPNKRKILRELFDARYSVNELVRTASGEAINKFIYDIMFRNKTLVSAESMISIRRISGLRNLIKNIKLKLNERKENVEKIIQPFNLTQEGLLRITYSQNNIVDELPIGGLFSKDGGKKGFYRNFNIYNEDVENYLLNIYDRLTLFPFLEKISLKDIKTSQFPIMDFATQYNMDMAEKGICYINKENQEEVIKNILDDFLNDHNLPILINYLKKYVRDIEVFSLEFNVNSNVSNEKRKILFKDVVQLSLGQKVVAMLDFILGYSDYSKDYRPLIIDQPEDNLDNQYIYNNMVSQLRRVKEKRQIIIATHNATIVTNAMADQVCVMQSNGEHGWIKTSGYPSERTIKKHIINYLEGGIGSFNHKIMVYNNVLK